MRERDRIDCFLEKILLAKMPANLLGSPAFKTSGKKMRAILFRAWDVGRKQMLIPGSCQASDITGLYHLDDFIGDKDFILMQYAGLKDASGFQIFEGDIVEYVLGGTNDRSRGVIVFSIVWSDKFFGWAANKIGQERPLNDFEMDSAWKVKIIGNCYEHPELLESEE